MDGAPLGEEQVARRLRALSEEAAQLASSLAAQPGEPARERRRHPSSDEALRMLTELRRVRYRHFPGAPFADPAWDMLLDLMAARQAGQKISVSALCMSAELPPTTALRWVNALVSAGLIHRVADQVDRRRVLVELTREGEERMEAYLRGVRRLLA
ncbi:MAG TPA: MarR family transcriptional regulator [Allosphingosinicella sp.]|jgi:predicted transcriptional regulator